MKDQKTYKIIGAAMEVHQELGCGFLEAVYHEALTREFYDQNIPFKSQPIVNIQYKGRSLKKTYLPDFICYDTIIVEIKALQNVSGIEESQMINYLKASGIEIGLLLNFGSKSLEYNRFVYSI
jgi:GxxExxY protein